MARSSQDIPSSSQEIAGSSENDIALANLSLASSSENNTALASASASSSSSSNGRKFILTTSDEEEFEVEEVVAMQCEAIKNMVEDDCIDNGIPLPNVSSRILSHIVEFIRKHIKDGVVVPTATPIPTSNFTSAYHTSSYSSLPEPEDPVKVWKAQYAKELEEDQETLFDIILAANYLDCKIVMEFTCQTVANMMKGKKPEEIREIFNIVNDYTEEEEQEVRKDISWALENV